MQARRSIGLALVAAALAGGAGAQGKLDKYVRDACGNNPMIRIQASRRVARAGAAGVAAVRGFIADKGKQELSAELVEALGRVEHEDARALLRELFGDPLFFWRAQAIRGLAFAPAAEDRALFSKALADVSWLVRRGALTGSAKADDKSTRPELLAGLEDADLRVRVTAAGLLLERGDNDGLPLLLACLDVEEDFFGDDFGARLRNDAFRYLRRAAGNDLDYRAQAARDERKKGIDRFAAWAKPRLDAAARPQAFPRTVREYVLGFERRSCQLGDTYLRVDAKGQLWRGLFTPTPVALDESTLEKLLKLTRAVPETLAKVHGRVLCEVERFAGLGEKREFSVRCARDSIPKELESLSAAWHELAAAK